VITGEKLEMSTTGGNFLIFRKLSESRYPLMKIPLIDIVQFSDLGKNGAGARHTSCCPLLARFLIHDS